MKSPKEMSRNELLELAALDAYGLLDEFEIDLFAAAYDEALPELQDEVMEFQALLAGDRTLLTAEEPVAMLRQRVLDRVAEAIEKQAPIATIGPRVQTVEPAKRERLVVGNGGQLWRAAAFVLAAASIVMAYFYTEAYRNNHEIAMLAIDKNTNAQLESEIGPTFKDFLFAKNIEEIDLVPTSSRSGARGTVLINRETAQAFVVFEGLPRTATVGYTLRVVDASGDIDEIQAFQSTGGLGGVLLSELTSSMLAAVTWEITDQATGDVILRGT
jgi:hypothetical protein